MEDELKLGWEIQMGLLPLLFPPYPERSDLEIHADLKPAREVGGDFYDFFLLEDDRLGLCVGDVAGKGVPAALFMAVAKSLVGAGIRIDASPGATLTRVNTEISRHNEASMFVTLFLAVLDLRSGLLTFTNAGHNPPYIRRGDASIVTLSARHGPVVGALEGISFDEGQVQLVAGDQLVAFTDGVTEAMNDAGGFYGDQRLKRLLHQPELATPEIVVPAVMNDVARFAGEADQADDITVLAIQFHGPLRSRYRLDFELENDLAEIARVQRGFDELAQEHDLPDSVRRGTKLVLDELLNNVISHGFESARSQYLGVSVELFSDRLKITIIDDGRPFDPFHVASPDTTVTLEERELGGLGLLLVRKMVDESSYAWVEGRNIVTLEKRLRGPEQK